MFARLRVTILCVLGLSAILPLGCSSNKDVSSACDKSPESKPFVFVYRMPGYSAPGASSEAGVVVAVWDGGAIVRACPGHAIGRKYMKGKITADQVAALRKCITESGLTSQEPGGNLVLDAAALHLTLQINGKPQTWAYSPDHETNAGIEAIQKFAIALDVADAQDANAETYRAYPSAWYKQSS